MGFMEDPGRFGLAVGLVKIDGNSLYLLECNDVFSKLSGLAASEEIDVTEMAFGSSFREGDGIQLVFNRTGCTILCAIRPADKGCLEIAGMDYTALKRERDLLEMRTTGYGHFLENLDGISFQRMMKPEMRSVFTTGTMEKMTGYPGDQARDLFSWIQIVHPDDRDRVSEIGLKLYDQRGYSEESEYRIIRKDGESRWVRTYDSHFVSEDGVYEMVQGLIVDVTEQKEQERRIREQNALLEELSLTDHMTGLSNRRFMEKIIDFHIIDYKRNENPFSLLLIDLDMFKKVNDTYGHDGGDAVICRMADILRHSLRETDFKARWGGEEFLVLLPRTNGLQALHICEKLMEITRREIVRHNSIDIRFTFSCGIAVNEKRLSADSLIKHADRALYQAKESGRNRAVLLSE